MKPNSNTHYKRNNIWFKRIGSMNKEELLAEVKKLEEQAKISKRSFDCEKSEFSQEVYNLKKHIENLEFFLIKIVEDLTEKYKVENDKRYEEEQERYNNGEVDCEKSEFSQEVYNLKKHIENLEFSLIKIVEDLTEKYKVESDKRYEEEQERYNNGEGY